jgi:hypothetical protein
MPSTTAAGSVPPSSGVVSSVITTAPLFRVHSGVKVGARTTIVDHNRRDLLAVGSLWRVYRVQFAQKHDEELRATSTDRAAFSVSKNTT